VAEDGGLPVLLPHPKAFVAKSMWVSGKNTQEIAIALGFPEDVVLRTLQLQRDRRTRKRTIFESRNGRRFSAPKEF
jgi:hypothetical protein